MCLNVCLNCTKIAAVQSNPTSKPQRSEYAANVPHAVIVILLIMCKLHTRYDIPHVCVYIMCSVLVRAKITMIFLCSLFCTSRSSCIRALTQGVPCYPYIGLGLGESYIQTRHRHRHRHVSPFPSQVKAHKRYENALHCRCTMLEVSKHVQQSKSTTFTFTFTYQLASHAQT
jgi:hypothetical protein